MASFSGIAPTLAQVFTAEDARDMADTSVGPPAPFLRDSLSDLGPAALAIFKRWLRWRLAEFVPAPFDDIARLSPMEVAHRLKLQPSVVFAAIEELRRVRDEIAANGATSLDA